MFRLMEFIFECRLLCVTFAVRSFNSNGGVWHPLTFRDWQSMSRSLKNHEVSQNCHLQMEVEGTCKSNWKLKPGLSRKAKLDFSKEKWWRLVFEILISILIISAPRMFLGAGADPEAIYNLRWILKTVL
jgi:hypothetical protein